MHSHLPYIYMNVTLVLLLQYYRVDMQKCSFGTVTAKGEYREKSNFSMELDKYVDGTNAGFFVWISRKSDNLRK